MNERCLRTAVRKGIIDFEQNETRDEVQVFPFTDSINFLQRNKSSFGGFSHSSGMKRMRSHHPWPLLYFYDKNKCAHKLFCHTVAQMNSGHCKIDEPRIYLRIQNNRQCDYFNFYDNNITKKAF